MPTYKSYIIGFLSSLLLTFAAYFAVTNHMFGGALLAVILIVAFIQLIVQLVFFLHLGQGKDGGWNLITLLSTAGIVFLLVVGSIWIMNHLNYNMSPDQMNQYIQSQDGI